MFKIDRRCRLVSWSSYSRKTAGIS